MLTKLIAIILLATSLIAYNDITNTPHYKYGVEKTKKLAEKDWSNVFIGDSHVEFHDFQEDIINLGIAGDTTTGVLKRLPLLKIKSIDNIFVLIGVNDILYWNKEKDIKKNYSKLIEELSQLKKTKVFIFSVLPVTKQFYKAETVNNRVLSLNDYIKKIVSKHQNISFINLHNTLVSDGYLKSQYSFDSLHLTEEAYVILEGKIENTITN